MNAGERIRKLRKEHSMTQSELGEILGVQKSAIAKYENGKVKNIKADTIKKLCDLFDVTTDYLLGLDAEEKVSNKYHDVPKDVVTYLFGGDPDLQLLRDVANDYVDYMTEGQTSADELISMFKAFNKNKST